MESKYDHGSGRQALSECIASFLESKSSRGSEHLSNFKAERYQIQALGNPTTYQLSTSGENPSEREEATFIVHGIIIEKDFPPITIAKQFRRDARRSQKIAAFARQYVALTGLNLEFFDNTLEGLARVHRFFQDSLPNDTLESFQIPMMEGFSIFTSHTRYFTPRRNCSSPILQNFGPDVDPNGDLETLKGHNYVHTEDNIVQYLGEKKTSSETSYYDINPLRFQKGDVVEITVSFFCIQTRMKKFKMITSLKSIVSLNDTIREKARKDEVKSQMNINTTKGHLKRRLIATDGEEDLARKYARMEL